MTLDVRRLALGLGWRIHRALFRISGGRVGTVSETEDRVGILFLFTTGRRSGKERRTALFHIRDGPDLIVVASNAGSARAPGWWRNLEADPDAEVRLGSERRRVRARRASADEEARLWPELIRRYDSWRRYRATTERDLPVVILGPRD
jgi:deazaflavin-dependent oxidoreductase (nitroreductase family)